MAVCPKCQTPLREDFGLETCTGCGVVVFVNDDKVSLQEDEVALEAESSQVPEPVSVVNDQLIEPTEDLSIDNSEDLIFGEHAVLTEDPLQNLNPNKESEFISEDTDLESLFEDDSVTSDFVPQDPSSHSDLVTDDLSDQTSDSELELSSLEEDVEESTVTDLNPEEESTIPTSADDFFEEMQLFGEMDSEKFQDAIYFFDIEIASIDSKDVRDEILDILDDSKLNLNIEKPNQKIKNGVLLLPAVPAVKAFIIIQRISHLPCELSWALVEVHDLGNEREESELLPNSDLGAADDFGLDVTDEFS